MAPHDPAMTSHEAQSYLYVSTGTGPYNTALDEIAIDEWWAVGTDGGHGNGQARGSRRIHETAS